MLAHNIKYLYLFHFLSCFRPHWPIEVVYFEQVAGSYALAMSVFSVVFVSQAVLEVPMGLISDRFGRRRAMIFGTVFISLGLSCYAFAPGFLFLAIGGFFEGASRALFSGTDTSLLYESLKSEEKVSDLSRYIGRAGGINQAALGISAAVGGLLAIYSLQAVMIAAIIPQLISIGTTLQLRDVGSEIGDSVLTFKSMLREAAAQFKSNAPLRITAIAETIEFGFGEAIFYFQGAFFQTVVPTWVLGPIRSLNHLTGFSGFWLAGNINGRWGSRTTLLWSNIIGNAVKALSIILASPWSPFWIAASNITYGPGQTARTTLLQQKFSDSQRATMSSMVSLTGGLLFSVVSFALGFLADATSPATAMLIGLCSNIYVVWLYTRLPDRLPQY